MADAAPATACAETNVAPLTHPDVLQHLFEGGFMPLGRAVACRRVCRAWASAARRAPLLFPASGGPDDAALLDLSECPDLDDAGAVALVAFATSKIGDRTVGSPSSTVDLRLDGLRIIDRGIVALSLVALRACESPSRPHRSDPAPMMRCLSLRGCGQVTLGALAAALTADGMRALEELNLAGCVRVRGPLAAVLGRYCRGLQRLDVTSLRHCTAQRVASFEPTFEVAASDRALRGTRRSVSWMRFVTANDDGPQGDGCASLSTALPALEALTVDETPFSDVDTLSRGWSRLRSLSMAATRLSNHSLRRMAECLEEGPSSCAARLQDLSLADNLELSDAGVLSRILAACTALTTLNVSSTALDWASPVVCSALAPHPSISFLRARECPAVRSFAVSLLTQARGRFGLSPLRIEADIPIRAEEGVRLTKPPRHRARADAPVPDNWEDALDGGLVVVPSFFPERAGAEPQRPAQSFEESQTLLDLERPPPHRDRPESIFFISVGHPPAAAEAEEALSWRRRADAGPGPGSGPDVTAGPAARAARAEAELFYFARRGRATQATDQHRLRM